MKPSSNKPLLLTLGLIVSLATSAQAFESTKVLPKGVRNVTIKTITTDVHSETNSDGTVDSLASPFIQDIAFSSLTQNETQLRQNQIEAMMMKKGISSEDPLGKIYADLAGNVTVTTPIMSYGISDKLTLAVAIPYYKANMAVDISFVPSNQAQQFADTLSDPLTNQVAAARSLTNKLNNVIPDLNSKLTTNGYQPLENWQGSGIGDISLVAKYNITNKKFLGAASTSGVVLPTGAVDDPNNLIDIPFGNGSLDVFTSLILDQPIGYGITINEYAKFTYQNPTFADKRMETSEESLAVETKSVRVKHGNKFESGVSMQLASEKGLLAGAGLIYLNKERDRFDALTEDTRRVINQDTEQNSIYAEARIGYSSVNAFQKGTAKAPFMTTLEYKSHIKSQNSPISNLITLDMALFF